MYLAWRINPTINLFCFNDLESTGGICHGAFAATENPSSADIMQLRFLI